jgi:serine/threonine protein kinase
MDLNVIAKRSKFKKKTETYKIDNVFDIIDIEECLSKDKLIPKVPIELFLYERNIYESKNTNQELVKEQLKASLILQNFNPTNIDFDMLNKNPFNINFNELQLEYPNGYTKLFVSEYYPIEIIGYGAFGLVISAIEIETQEKCAVKIIDKNNIPLTENIDVMNYKINILQKLENSRILKIYEVLETQNYFFIFMELLEGGSLKDLILRRYINNNINYLFKESECSLIMKGVLEALDYLHKNKIIHRDIKPENIMFKKKDDLSSVILCDFGFLYHLSFSEDLIQGTCGTTIYMSPEIIKNRKYDYLVDSYAAGFVLYLITSGGKHPFYNYKMTRDEYIEIILKKENYNFISGMPLLARNLFLKLCKYDPFFRYECNKALKHPFITRNPNDKIPLMLVDEFERKDKIKQFKALLCCSIIFNTAKNLFNLSIKIENKNVNLNNNNNINNNNNNGINNFTSYNKLVTKRQSTSKLLLKMNMLFEKNIQINNKNTKNSKKNLPKVNDNENNNSSNETSHLSNPSQQNKQIILKTNQNKVQNNTSKDKKNKVINRKCSSRGESNVKVIVKNEKIIIDSALNRRGSISGQEKDKLKLIKLKKNIYKKNSVAPFLYEDKQN